MLNEALAEGFYEPPHLAKKYPRIQILTIEQILKGAEIQHPQMGLDVTFAKAERKEKGGKQQRLL